MAIRKGERKYFTREERERFIRAVMKKELCGIRLCLIFSLQQV